MKYLISSILFIFSISFLFAQNNSNSSKDTKIRTEKIEVAGTCGMCKKRIEKAAYIHGVKRVEWDKETKMLEVTYNSKVVTIDEIAKSIAAAGHDANGIHADETVYKNLPNCCAYRTGSTCTH